MKIFKSVTCTPLNKRMVFLPFISKISNINAFRAKFLENLVQFEYNVLNKTESFWLTNYCRYFYILHCIFSP